jgi:hypothetical protein
MEAIEAVLDLAKERDQLAEELETYEEWFEELVGRKVTFAVKEKKKTRWVDCTVTEFVEGEGWELTAEEDEVFIATLTDLFNGKMQIIS